MSSHQVDPKEEQAVQIFEVLRQIGHRHSFSAGLVIGGKSLKDEKVLHVATCTFISTS